MAGMLATAGFAFRSLNKAKGPLLNLQASVLDLGEGKPGELLSGTLDIRNEGTDDLTFNIMAGCACAQLEPKEGTVPPGASLPIRVGVRLRQLGVRERVRLLIQTNDPRTQKAEYVAEANCPAPFDVTPSLVDFGSVLEGQESSIVVTVRGAGGAPLCRGTQVGFAVSNDLVSVEAVDREGDERRLLVRLRPTVPRGRLQAELKVKLSDRESAIEVPVTADVVGHVLTAPQSLVLPGGGEAKLLVWRPDGKPLGKLERLESPDGISAGEVSEPTATRRVFRVRDVGPSNSGGPLELRLRFETLPDAVVISVTRGG
jgi:hypothetical protein